MVEKPKWDPGEGKRFWTEKNRERLEKQYRPFRLAGITLHEVYLRDQRSGLVERLTTLVDNDPVAASELRVDRLPLSDADAFGGGQGWYNLATIVRKAGATPFYPECRSLPPSFEGVICRMNRFPDGNLMLSFTFILDADATETCRKEFIESHDIETVEEVNQGDRKRASFVQKQDPFHTAEDMEALARDWLANRVPGLWLGDKSIARVPTDLIMVAHGFDAATNLDDWDEVLRFLDWDPGGPVFGGQDAAFFFRGRRSGRKPINRGHGWVIPATVIEEGKPVPTTNWYACHHAVEGGFAPAGLAYHDFLCLFYREMKAPLLHDLEVAKNRELVDTTKRMRRQFLGRARNLSNLEAIVADLAAGIRATETGLTVVRRSRASVDRKFLEFRLRGLKSIASRGNPVDLEKDGPAFLERIYGLTEAALEDAHKKLTSDDAYAGRCFQAATATSNWRLAVAVGILAAVQVIVAIMALRSRTG
ncbi:MAG: hypothetical protein HYT80_02435 [Euryarchaeota archaeon]|nr:hypothetical protein [Euryarchaeota archaeon]